MKGYNDLIVGSGRDDRYCSTSDSWIYTTGHLGNFFGVLGILSTILESVHRP